MVISRPMYSLPIMMPTKMPTKMPTIMHFILTAVACLFLVVANTASAEYFRQKESKIDPDVFRIDEKESMGSKLDPGLELLDLEGKTFLFGDMAKKPTIIVWSYYRCDGSCSAVNWELLARLKDIDRMTVGQEYQVLTLSFDKHDTLKTMQAFEKHVNLPEVWKRGWTFALVRDPEQIKETTDKMGFRYFWAPQDQVFYHPNVFIFLSPEGRITRYLYALTNDKQDVELALLEARQGQFTVNQTIDYVVGLCYSYNYKEGRYTYNIPLFVGAGSLALGISLLIGSILFYRSKKLSGGVIK